MSGSPNGTDIAAGADGGAAGDAEDADHGGMSRGRFLAPAVALAVIVLAGVVWGLLWWRIAPTAATQVVDGAVYLNGHDDLFASQDSWFAIVGAGAGALLSVAWPALTRWTPVVGIVAGLVGSAVAGLLAWQLGSWLGPDPLRAQLHAGVKAPITPLVLHTPIAVLVAPMIFAAVRIVMELLAHFLDGRRGPEPMAWPPPYSAPQGVHVEQGQ